VPARLVALRLPTESFVAELDRVWDEGDAVLPIPESAPEATVQRTLRSLRPAVLRQLDPSGAVVDEPLAEAPDVEDGAALVVPTSGSTGQPKGVVLTHDALRASVAASLERLDCHEGEQWLLALPVHHVAGIQVVLRSRALGTEPALSPESRDDLGGADAAHVSLVPTQLRRLVDAGADLARFRTILLGGARPEPELLDTARQAGANVVVSYGMTETSGGCVYDGVPLDGVEVEVADDGRIRLRGNTMAAGYRTRRGTVPVAASDGWLVTDDLGRLDGQGRLEVVGRVDDVIVSGGMNVPATAVAATLRSHPQVRDAAVAGRHDTEWGEAVVAVIVPRDPDHPPSLDELRDHVRLEWPPSYAPRDLVVVDALPRDAMGKLPRAAVRLLVQ
jgi:O-succinylbenzoic acid--CoA ligase